MLRLAPLGFASLGRALSAGLATAHRARGVSLAYGALFTLAGAAILAGLVAAGMAPFVIAAAGAYMLVGPIVLAGFFGIASAVEQGRSAGLADVIEGFRRPSASLWALALVCALLFMIFVTDAGILYSYMIGGSALYPADLLPAANQVLPFLFWVTVSGSVIAFLLFAVSAFAVPLLCERRADLVGAVIASVRVVFGSFPVVMAWALLISLLTMGAILLLPLFPLVLPWLAYASHALYREALPPAP